MTLHPEDLRYWVGWIVLGTVGFTVLYWVVKFAVIAAIIAARKAS